MIINKENFQMLAKTMTGLEVILASELENLGAKDIYQLNRAVSFSGDLALLYKSNLWCRTALRILKPIMTFTVGDEDVLYKVINKIEWENLINPDSTIAVDSVIDDSIFTNSLYVSQRVKDAIVDRFNKKFSRRPSVDLDNPDLKINIHIYNKECIISLDSSGASLHKRGYRQEAGLAPLNEVLAAGLIMLSGWNRDSDFIDPMCGSGTIPIEAALIAFNIPPAHYRKEFAFMKWKDFDKTLWDKIVKESLSFRSEFNYKIIGSDVSQESIDYAQTNIEFANLQKNIILKKCSFDNQIPPSDKGIIIMNPPYGERLKLENRIDFYKSIGNVLKSNWSGYNAYIISPSSEELKFIGLRPSGKIKIFNGPLECYFIKFELYHGSKKKSKN